MKFRLCVLVCLAVLLLAAPAQAAGEELQTESDQAQLIQSGDLGGPYTLPEDASLQGGDSTLLYTLLQQGFAQKKTEINISAAGITTAELSILRTTYSQVANDHPEFFYIPNNYSYSYYSSGKILSVKVSYPDGLDAQCAAFDEAVAEALAQVDGSRSPMEQALAAHDYLVAHCAYNWDVATTDRTDTPYVHSAYGALVNGDAVCQGYALAYKLLLDALDIDCALVSSTPMNHVWNLVELDGVWYHVDVTWDDPTPNVEGGGPYHNFLRSDAGISDTGHHDWEDLGVDCASDYQEGWWLNALWFPIHSWEGAYYYIKTGLDSFEYRIYRTDTLEEAGSAVTTKNLDTSYSSRNGVLWLDGQLYYTKASGSDARVLTRLRLSDGASAPVGTIPFTRTASADGYYPSDYDGVGLRYDPETGLICTSSNTRPDLEMPTFVPRTYPVEWDLLSTNKTSLAGGALERGGPLQVGVVWAEPGDTPSPRVLAAFYEGGRLTGVCAADSSALTEGLNVLELDAPDKAYDSVRVFLLSGLAELTPWCESASVSP